MTSIFTRLAAALERQGDRVLVPARARPGDPVVILAEHPLDFWHEAQGVLLADFGQAGKLIAYREKGETALILAVIEREEWSRSPIEQQARPDILVCGTIAALRLAGRLA